MELINSGESLLISKDMRYGKVTALELTINDLDEYHKVLEGMNAETKEEIAINFRNERKVFTVCELLVLLGFKIE